MNKELCFRIEFDDLFLTQVLVDYDNIPIFFLCKGKEKNYLALCVDCENYNYIVVEVSLFDIYDLLHGNISMRGAILKHREYWMVFSGIDITDDIVERRLMKDIDQGCLPMKDAYFKVLTESMEQYVENIDKMILIQQNYFSISDLANEYGKEIRSAIDLTQYRFINKTTRALGAYSEWKDIILDDGVVVELDDRFCIYKNSIIAA